jgi:serine/threonine protein kinase
MAPTDHVPLREHERSALAAVLRAYEIHEVLGHGAFGSVYAATHRRLGREVAIKVMSAEMLGDPCSRDRFATEARVLSSLHHPHVVRVHGYVEDDVCALIMERLRGGRLAERLMPSQPLPCAQSCAWALAALYGLEHAHRRGILHRDVKPENLLFTQHGLLKVTDFGLAKAIGAAAGRFNTNAIAFGTPAYMAPEQISRAAGSISPATDVWALGAVLFEMLAGERPFADGEVGDVLLKRITTDPPPLRSIETRVPEQVAAVVMCALARRPDQRYPSAGEFASALERAIDEGLPLGALAATGTPLSRSRGD